MSEGFASRWSRVKRAREQLGDAAVIEPSPALPPSNGLDASEDASKPPTAQLAEQDQDTQAVVNALPPVSELTSESDFTAFMQPKVPQALKRQALKQLFRDPHFNTMDGLDIYIDDYSVFTPIPEDWYKDIPSWQAMLNPKPPMVVTDGGYAVEADSEEGLATLKARAGAQAEAAQADAARAEEATAEVDAPDVITGETTANATPIQLTPDALAAAEVAADASVAGAAANQRTEAK